MNDTAILQGQSLSKSYGTRSFLKDVSLSVRPGSCLGVLGDNGSGKSTLMSILAGMLPADGGAVLYHGTPITRAHRQHVGYVPQVPILMDDLTVDDNLRLWHSVYHRKDFAATLAEIPAFLGIDAMRKKKVGALSGGMKKKVAIAVALMNHPDVLILDEAFAALDAKTVDAMMAHLRSIPSMGMIYSSHNIHEIVTLCDEVVVLHQGEIVHTAHGVQEYDEAMIQTLYKQF